MIHSSMPLSGSQDNFPRFFIILWERRFTVLICLVASMAIVAIAYVFAPTRYRSEVILALDARKIQALPTESSVVSPLPQESPVLRTELDIISSRVMAQRVLMDLQEKGVVGGRQTKYDRTNESAPGTEPTPEPAGDAEKIIDELVNHVRVVNDGRSYTIYISYDARNPTYAAIVANAFGQAYIDYQLDLQHTATRRVSEWLGDRLVSLRTKVEESERAATAFREEAGLPELGGITLEAQQLSGLNTELTALQARAASAKARLETALQVQREEDRVGMMEVLSSPSIQQLRGEQARIARAITEIRESGARMNPQLPQLTSQLASLKKQITFEISQVVDSLRNEIAVNDNQQRQLEHRLIELQNAMAANGQATVKLRQLEREAAANRTIYEAYLARYKQTVEQEGIAAPEARIISQAMPSASPVSPNPILWAIMALVSGTAVGVVAALAQNLLDKSIRSISILQQKTGLPIIARIPSVPSVLARQDPKTSATDAAFHNAVADLQAHLRLDDKTRVIALTSSVDGEGKSFVTANLARSMALSGLHVIVIDANLREPAMDREFDITSSPDLARAVMFEGSIEPLIQRDHAACVDVIASQVDDLSRDAILGTRRFANLITNLKHRYDLVLIDTPAASHGVDLTRIALLADVVAFVVRQDIAQGDILQNAVIKLRLTGKNVAGIILNGAAATTYGEQTRRRMSKLLRKARFSGRKQVSVSPRPLVAPNAG